MPELERMLRQCQLLESIDIIADVDFGIPRISKDDLKQWMINNVQQLPSLQSADINSYDHPHLVEYLIFKCPRMRNLALSNIETDDHGTVGRIVDAIKNVYSLNLDCWRLGNATDAEHVLSILKNRNNSIILRPCQSGDISGLLMALNAKKNREDNTTHCAICISETDFPEEVDLPEILNRIIKAIAPFPNLKVEYVDEDVLKHDNRTTHQGTTTFKRMIDIMSVAKDVCFTCTYIPYLPLSVDGLLFEQLQTLKICGAVVDHKVLTLMSRTVPKLQNFILNSCILNPFYPQHHRIDMPHTAFNTLSITSRRSIWKSYDCIIEDTENYFEEKYKSTEKINSKISIKQGQMVLVKITTLSDNMVEHYILKPGSLGRVMATSKDEYSTYAPGWPNIVIVCKSLEMLKLDLGALFVELKPGIDRPPIEDTGYWRQIMEAELLKDLYNFN